MTQEFQQANLFELSGDNIQVTYASTSLAEPPLFSCRDGNITATFTQIFKIALVMKYYKLFDPLNVSMFGAIGVVFEANDVLHLRRQFSIGA